MMDFPNFDKAKDFANKNGNGKTQPGSGETDWPEPVDCFTSLETEPIDVTEDEVPSPLWPFIKDTAERMGVAASTIALCALVTCSAVISDEWCVRPKRYDDTWTENPRLWGAIVGSPSVLKSPVIATCTRPVDLLEAAARRQWQEDMGSYKARHAGEEECDELAPKLPRRLVESTTIEALQEVLRTDADARFIAPARKVLVRQDELSEWAANLDRYSNGRSGGDRGAYLRLYNGGPFSVDRIGRGAFTASNWSGCLLGGIQPEPIQRIAKQAVDDGLLQRFVYDVPPDAKGGADRTPDRAALERYHRLIPALAALHPGLTTTAVRGVALHADAHAHRESIDDLARGMATMPDVSGRLRAAFGKWPGLFARLCLTFHLIELADARVNGDLGPPGDVVPTLSAERVANYMRRVLLPHLLRADAVMFKTVQTGHARWIAGHILARKLGRITVRDVQQNYWALRAPESRGDLDSVMTSLVGADWLDPVEPRNRARPVTTWLVNPEVHSLFAPRAEEERRDRQQRQEETVRRRQASAPC
jgi:hypothetical protein